MKAGPERGLCIHVLRLRDLEPLRVELELGDRRRVTPRVGAVALCLVLSACRIRVEEARQLNCVERGVVTATTIGLDFERYGPNEGMGPTLEHGPPATPDAVHANPAAPAALRLERVHPCVVAPPLIAFHLRLITHDVLAVWAAVLIVSAPRSSPGIGEIAVGADQRHAVEGSIVAARALPSRAKAYRRHGRAVRLADAVRPVAEIAPSLGIPCAVGEYVVDVRRPRPAAVVGKHFFVGLAREVEIVFPEISLVDGLVKGENAQVDARLNAEIERLEVKFLIVPSHHGRPHRADEPQVRRVNGDGSVHNTLPGVVSELRLQQRNVNGDRVQHFRHGSGRGAEVLLDDAKGIQEERRLQAIGLRAEIDDPAHLELQKREQMRKWAFERGLKPRVYVAREDRLELEGAPAAHFDFDTRCRAELRLDVAAAFVCRRHGRGAIHVRPVCLAVLTPEREIILKRRHATVWPPRQILSVESVAHVSQVGAAARPTYSAWWRRGPRATARR
mmetsp:Transcript_19171/g.59605  ORF Transcript_19171/g.59605 Transcript_19171/m.59605 type:complete len:504 (+) Transcript_19171:383-1894(+)